MVVEVILEFIRALLKEAALINEMSEDKNIIEITLPNPRDQQEFQFYQNVKTKFIGHLKGIWLMSEVLTSDPQEHSSKKLAICTFICQKRGYLVQVYKPDKVFVQIFA